MPEPLTAGWITARAWEQSSKPSIVEQVSCASEDGAYSGDEESSLEDNDRPREDELSGIEEQEQSDPEVSDPEDPDPEDFCHKWNSKSRSGECVHMKRAGLLGFFMD